MKNGFKLLLAEIRHFVFWPTLIGLLFALVLSLLAKDAFLNVVSELNNFILDHFGWLFSYGTLLMFACCVLAFLSPLGNVRIGGAEAKAKLRYSQWFSIVLCTTIATGILFWAMAEPIYHITSPPESLNIGQNPSKKAVFAMSAMYLHWSFTPYAIYSVPALLFALAFYNNGKSFSISSIFFPLIKKDLKLRYAYGLDAICLFALVAGMSANLGAGLLTLSGGVGQLFNLSRSTWLLSLICLLVVSAFILSAASGVLKGIKYLSFWNVFIFIILLFFFLVVGPGAFILELSMDSLSEYISNFLTKSTFTGDASGDSWPKNWTVFYWANWLAWAPVTALFLGNLAYGRTVRQFLTVTWILPSVFAIIWMSIFSGTAIYFEQSGIISLSELLIKDGPETLIYAAINRYPFGSAMSVLFFIAVFISFVTAADSSTIAMSSLSSNGLQKDDEPPILLKMVWGILVGAMALIMVSYAGIDGIKMMSNLGGLPVLIIMLVACIALISLCWKSLFVKNNSKINE